MIFFARENFPPPAAALLKAFDFSNEHIHSLDDYPRGIPDDEWLAVVGKRRPRPFIVSFDDDILRNIVTRQILRETGCSFIYLKGWEKLAWEVQAWKLLKAWPHLRELAAESERLRRQCVIEVSPNSKPKRTNLD